MATKGRRPVIQGKINIKYTDHIKDRLLKMTLQGRWSSKAATVNYRFYLIILIL